jgi:hypothetical protein
MPSNSDAKGPVQRSKKFLCVSSQLRDVRADAGQRMGGNPPNPLRLIGAFCPMLGWSEENRDDCAKLSRLG